MFRLRQTTKVSLTYKCSERPTLTLAMDDVSHTWRVADVRNGYFLPPTVGGFIAQ